MLKYKKTALVVAFTSATILSSAVEATQISAAGYARTAVPTSSVNNNLTMLDSTGGFVGGANDVSMSWDGTVFTASSDYTGPGGASNMTLSSPSTFFGYLWTAHDIQVFRPGTYAFNTALGGGNSESGIQTLTVGAWQLGVHMLVDWNNIYNLDISLLWNANEVFGATTAQQVLTGGAYPDFCV